MATNFNKMDLKSDSLREFVDKFNTLFDSYKNIDQLIEGILQTAHGGTGRSDGRVTSVAISQNGSDNSINRGGIAYSDAYIDSSVDDFDDFINQGLYYTEIETNAPETNGKFLVFVIKGGTTQLVQIAFSQIPHTAYYRNSSDSGETWSAWIQFLSSAEATASQTGWVRLLDAIDSSLDTTDGTAATPKAVKTAYDHFETPATANSLGTVKIGDGITVDANGTIACDFSSAVTSSDKKKVANSYAVKAVKDALNSHISVYENYVASNDDAVAVLAGRLDGHDDEFSELIPSGTKMLFKQASAPNGWTKLTDSSLNNAALRVVTGDSVTVKSTGKAFTQVFNTIITSSVNTGGTIGDTVLRVVNLPAHRHGTVYTRKVHDGTGEELTVCSPVSIDSSALMLSDNSDGIDEAHTHSFTVNSHSHDFELDINYIDVIICEKD